MHAKVISIQIFQYFRQIPPWVCTLVLFIYIMWLGTSNTIIMNIIICGVYSRAAFIFLDVALWGAVYSRAALNQVNTVV